MNCYSISAGSPFLSTLADWILKEYGTSPDYLPRVLVLLPNRRACRSLQEMFLEVTGGKPLLLPRIRPIGEVEGADFGLFGLTQHLPGPISPIRRHLLLTKLVMEFEKKRSGREYEAAQATQLAQQLAELLDDVVREECDFAALEKLVPEDLANHWQETVHFLRIVSHSWPEILREEGAIDLIQQRNSTLAAISKAVAQTPPAYPIIAAGSTGSQPATAALMSVINRLPQGRIILPGLDQSLPKAVWDVIGPTHPQFMLKQLLEHIECPREQVKQIGSDAMHERVNCLQAVFHPPEITAGWRNLSLPLAEGLKGLRLATADTTLDEARIIAIALRESLETPGKTAALITPDRALARMVVAQMQRFGVILDDSAGRRLSDTPPGCFLRLTAEMCASLAAPSALLALLRHPLAACGMEPAECRNLARIIELKLLRGLRPTPGFAPLIQAARAHRHLPASAVKLVETLAAKTKTFTDLLKRNSAPLRELLQAHLALAEWLAATDNEAGAESLWATEAGIHLAEFMAELLSQADALPLIDSASYPGFFESLLSAQSFWPRYGQHPRLFILSPIEARLQRFDMIVLGGLNEGVWPGLTLADAWMSRPMRQNFGLPPSERDIGRVAHDMYLQCTASELLLTRSQKTEGAPTVPSRWLVRLTTLVRGINPELMTTLDASGYYRSARDLLEEASDMLPLAAPAPVPPLAARPRKLRVTAIDDWLRDPYFIYAKYILKFRQLDALDQELEAADFGNVIHHAFELFAQKFPSELPKNAYEELIECGREAFAPLIDRPAVAMLWWPRFETMAEWVIEQEILRRPEIKRVYSELGGTWSWDAPGGPFTLSTRIDRLEITRDGKAIIGDYKTGRIPTDKEIASGLANQLLLEALIAERGELLPKPETLGEMQRLEYWKLSGNKQKCEITKVNEKDEVARALIDAAHTRVLELVARFDDAAMPYRAQANAKLFLRYNDYEHLTRRQEWQDA